MWDTLFVIMLRRLEGSLLGATLPALKSGILEAFRGHKKG
jgi:hypothetical protein